jgi:hypothetical protein
MRACPVAKLPSAMIVALLLLALVPVAGGKLSARGKRIRLGRTLGGQNGFAALRFDIPPFIQPPLPRQERKEVMVNAALISRGLEERLPFKYQ